MKALASLGAIVMSGLACLGIFLVAGVFMDENSASDLSFGVAFFLLAVFIFYYVREERSIREVAPLMLILLATVAFLAVGITYERVAVAIEKAREHARAEASIKNIQAFETEMGKDWGDLMIAKVNGILTSEERVKLDNFWSRHKAVYDCEMVGRVQ